MHADHCNIKYIFIYLFIYKSFWEFATLVRAKKKKKSVMEREEFLIKVECKKKKKRHNCVSYAKDVYKHQYLYMVVREKEYISMSNIYIYI